MILYDARKIKTYEYLGVLCEIANKDNDFKEELWQELYSLTKKHKVTFNKVKGHSDVELNNRCDELARNAIPKN